MVGTPYALHTNKNMLDYMMHISLTDGTWVQIVFNSWLMLNSSDGKEKQNVLSNT